MARRAGGGAGGGRGKKRSAPAQEAAATTQAPENVVLPDEGKLMKLLKNGIACDSELAEVRGGYAEQVQAALARDHIHKVALGIGKRIYKKLMVNPAAAAELVYHLDYYLDAMGARQGDLFRDAEPAAENVRQFPAQGAATA